MTRTDLETWEGRHPSRRRGGDGNSEAAFVTKLGAAKHALALAQEVPDLEDVIDHAEAVRAAAKSLHISAPGINAWTRFIVDAERKAWGRIEKMRKAGELATGGKGGDRRSKTNRKAGLDSLIERNASQRTSEWSMLARLTEFQLNELEEVANNEDRILTRVELLKLAKAGMPTPAKMEKIRSTEELAFIMRAQERAAEEGYQGEDIQIDDDAKVHRTERGAWIEALVWVEDPLGKSDLNEN